MGKTEKGQSPNGDNKKTRHAKFSEKQNFLSPDRHKYLCVSRGKKCSFSENLACYIFLLPPFGDSPVRFITDKCIY